MINTLKSIKNYIQNSEDQEIVDAKLSAMLISGFVFDFRK